MQVLDDLLHLVMLRMRQVPIVLLSVDDILDRRQLSCPPTLPQVVQVSLMLFLCPVDGFYLQPVRSVSLRQECIVIGN